MEETINESTAGLKQESPVDASISRQTNEIASLLDIISSLESKLSQVLTQSAEKRSTKGMATGDTPVLANVANRISEGTKMITEARGRIKDIISRLEV